MDVIWTIICWILGIIGGIVVLIVLLMVFALWNPWPAKHYLISYEPEMFTALNATSFTYFLTVRIESPLWGKKVVRQQFDVPHHQSLKSYTSHWDKLIETKQPLK